MEDNSKPPPMRLPTKRVRCLGYGEDHWFWNDGTDANRKCPKCRARDKNSMECGGIRVVKDPGE